MARLGRIGGDKRRVGQMHVRRGRDLPGNDGQPGRDECFAGHARRGIRREDGIKHGVRNLVGDLVRMSLGNGFRGKKMTVGHAALGVKGMGAGAMSAR